jgi:uncharacterized membrane protein YciS (DUF1049 family)
MSELEFWGLWCGAVVVAIWHLRSSLHAWRIARANRRFYQRFPFAVVRPDAAPPSREEVGVW